MEEDWRAGGKKWKLKPLHNAVLNLVEAAVGEKCARLKVAGEKAGGDCCFLVPAVINHS